MITEAFLIQALENQKDSLEAIIEKRINSKLMLIGINIKKPEEAQDLMSELREIKRERSTVKYKIMGWGMKLFWAFVVFTFMTCFALYCQKQEPVPMMPRDDKAKISELNVERDK